MQAGGRRRDRALLAGRTGSGSRRGPAHRAPVGRRYRAATASRRARRSPGRAPARERRMKALSRPPSPFSSTVSIELAEEADLALVAETHDDRRRASFLAGRTKARQREPSIRLCSVASIAGSVRRARSAGRSGAPGSPWLSLTTSASPGCSRSGRSRDAAVLSSGASPGLTTSSRAASRGAAGRNAMRSAGKSKSKRSVRMHSRVMPGFVPGRQVFGSFKNGNGRDKPGHHGLVSSA